ncbi:MAG: DNA polymerase Y family protein [Candidatus Obscuribacterales bacterium]|nr:DNA polymerase Y family protein [Candidatus Obscuribacterales bacterium]
MVLPCRIACLRIPRFQIVVHQKAEAALKGKPLALIAGSSGRAIIQLCSKEAALERVYPGMKLSEARAVCANLLWREYDGELYQKRQTELLEKLVMASPQVSNLEIGSFLLNATGLSHLGGEAKFCRHLQRLINMAGFAEMQIGIADSAFAAQVASKFKRSKQYIVPAGKDKDFLSALSVQHLPVSAETQERLFRLGVKTIGQFLQIPVEELQERFGKEGLLALELGSGLDRREAQLLHFPAIYESFVDLNFPVESLQQTQFILKSMLENICSRLKENGLEAEELLISFFNENDKFDERPLKLLRPSNSPRFLLEILKLSLEATPLAREYTALNIRISQLSQESWEQNKVRIVESKKQESSKELVLLNKEERRSQKHASTRFVAESKNSQSQAEPFALLLQRFITRLGSKSVVHAVPGDQHIPDLAASFLPVVEEEGSILSLTISYADPELSGSPLACGLVLKKSAKPQPVLLEYQGKVPKSLNYQGRWFKIKELSEPEKLSGLWWENPIRKSYYIAFIEAGHESYLVLLVHDYDSNAWQIDGFFD